MSNDTTTAQWYDVSRVTDWLLVGGEIGSAEHMAWLAEQGVTTVINAACEVSDRQFCEQRQFGYYHMYWYDDQQHKPSSEFLYVLGWVGDEEAKLAAAGKSFCVYVHCQMGINRGPLLAISSSPRARASPPTRHGSACARAGRQPRPSASRSIGTRVCRRWRSIAGNSEFVR